MDGAAASKYFVQALIDDPDNPDILNSAFLALHNQGRMSEAVVLARRLIDIKPNAAVAGLTLAIDAIMRGQFDEAREWLDNLPLEGYNSLLVPLLSAWVAVGRERFATANTKIDSLESNQAFFVFRDFHRGLINDLAGVDEIAERSYLAAYDIQSGGSYRTVTALGGFYERSGRPDEAITLYEDYLENNPDSVWFEAAMKRVAEQPSGLLPAIRRGWLRLKPLPQICSWALTMHCFVMSLLIFFGGSGAWRVGKELVLRPLFWLFGLKGG
ncbi:MAG: tetratricopeptide repeat protein [Planctomycetes bacterium]|nr:tetratricopeptide repeat protein [Planctomycetota bacterium]